MNITRWGIVELALIVIFISHFAIFVYAGTQIYDSGRLRGMIDFPVGGYPVGDNMPIPSRWVESEEKMNENLIVFVAMNSSFSNWGEP